MNNKDRESGADTDDVQISEKPAATETTVADTTISDLNEDAKGSTKKHVKKCSKSKSKKAKASSKKKKNKTSSSSHSDSSDSDTEASSSDDSDDEDTDTDSESEIEVKKRKGSSKKAAVTSSKLKKIAKLKKKIKKKSKSKRSKRDDSDSSDSSSDSSSSSDDDEDPDTDETADGKQDKESKPNLQKTLESIQQQLQLSQLQQQQMQARLTALSLNSTPQATLPQAGQLNSLAQLQLLNQQQVLNQGLPTQLTNQQLLGGTPLPGSARPGRGSARRTTASGSGSTEDAQEKRSKKDASSRKGGLGFKRVDWVWDSTIHTWKLQDTADVTDDAQYEGYLFHVRRTFDWEGKYKATFVDIKSKPLRECLQTVIGNIKGLSLVEETPKIDPNILFLYLDDLRAYLSTLKTLKPTGASRKERKKEDKRNNLKRRHLKVLVKYIDQDYAKVKKSLNPMLENGLITFDLLWALWKPGTLIYSSTYGTHDEPRAFKVDMAEKHYSMMRGNFYWIDGKYLEYDGKQFGFGSMSVEIADFQGARKITSLSCYPLEYHKSEAKTREALVARGKKFVQLSGVHYKNHQGMAFFKKKKAVVKVNINGRIMVDPAIHRRINPNYPISVVRAKDHDIVSDGEDSEADSSCCCQSDSEVEEPQSGSESQSEDKPKYVTKAIKDGKGDVRFIKVRKEDDDAAGEKLEAVPAAKDATETLAAAAEAAKAKRDKAAEEEKAKIPEFSDEEYLIASPVVLGFAFSEKMWLEFTVSGIKEIQWNENAYESLVLESKKKEIVKALVESHKYHAAESIDDVIQGKGKGLVAVLHGPPGTGKTLTAEGISELLKCPLYMASAGELGTDSRYLEQELQKILDICHAWGAILLLDEADVFLEKRNMHDIHRNALVSIFLRQLEYFQGILFLTTNRVETFDDAFQSRIHIGLRYDALEPKAKRSIFKIFVERVRVLENIDTMPFTEEDFADLGKHDLNGRQIKNTVRTAQALAVNKGEALSMGHIRQVLDVLMSFDQDLRGGSGYQEAMRSYF